MNDQHAGIRINRLFLLGCGAIYCGLTISMIYLGRHHVDEGYYHLIAQLTASGKMPYKDYFYVQTPLYPYIYGTIFRLFGPGFGIARGFSAVLGLFSLFLAGRIARKREGIRGAAVAAGLIVCQPFTVYYLTIIKLYALTGLILVLVVASLEWERGPQWRYGAAAFWLAVATGIRLTVAPAIVLLAVLAFIRTRKIQSGLVVLLVSGVTLTAIMAPFFICAQSTLYYDIVGYHFDKESFSVLRQVFHRMETLSKLSKLYFLPGVLLISAVSIRSINRLRKNTAIERFPGNSADAAWIIASVVAFHFVSQAPYVHRYLAMMVPAMAAILGPEIVRLERFFCLKNWLPVPGWIFGIACVLTICARGVADYAPLKNGGAMLQLKSIAEQIKMITPVEKPILTFNNSLAVESDRRVVHGDEMNVLSYNPEWPESRCRKYAVMNVRMLEREIAQKTFGAVVVTKYSFLGNFPTFYNPGEKGARPRIMAALEQYYVKIRTYPGFGYLEEDADLYIPRFRTNSELYPGEAMIPSNRTTGRKDNTGDTP
jgi:hypothetical protein